jgi:hypothetical protein
MLLRILSSAKHFKSPRKSRLISRESNFQTLSQGFNENKTAAAIGGKIAGDARRQLERESGKPVISQENYLGRLISAPEETEQDE